MAFHQLITTQTVPADLDTVWHFISRPENLGRITPPHMGFHIITQAVPAVMYPGMIIGYKLSPLPGLRLTWVTEITHIREREYFVDEQRVGPYSMWHHEHKIEPVADGVLMTDIVSYQLPFGPLGSLAHGLFVKRQLQSIFEYRRQAVDALFGPDQRPAVG
jgi:ligand-binding SRPBCC domain-containing protein